jgi:hypothetical protein
MMSLCQAGKEKMMEKHCQILRRLEAVHDQVDQQQEDQEDEDRNYI